MHENDFPLDQAAAGYGFLARQIGLVGNRDPVDILAATPLVLGELVHDAPRERLSDRPRDLAWCGLEIIGHLADIEWVFGYRTRSVLCDEEPVFAEMDHDLWVSTQRHRDADVGDLLDRFTAVRGENVRFWRTLPDGALDRVGHHPGAGIPYSLRFMRVLQAGHDLAHADQLKRTLAPS